MLLSTLLNKLKNRCQRFFKAEASSHIRRLQVVRLMGIVLGVLVLTYGGTRLLFSPSSETSAEKESKEKLRPTHIETVSDALNPQEMWRYKIEDETKILREEVSSLKTFIQEVISQNKTEESTEKSASAQDLEARVLDLESALERKIGSLSSPPPDHYSSRDESAESQQEPEIQKFTLNLSDNPKHTNLKTAETTIPAGAFAKTVLLSGLDASAAMNASSDPRPMLLRLIDYGTFPRKFQSDLKDCHCTASAFGDLSSERVYARLEKLTCVMQGTGEIIETQVAGYIAGPDGKAGIRGIVASKDGQFLARSLMGGLFSGLSNVANPGNRRGMSNPFVPGGTGVPPISMGENFTSGMASGATNALDRLSQYYIDRAEQLQPVIQIAAGQVVDIVFTEGTFIGSQTIKQEIEKNREFARSTTQEKDNNL